LRIVLSGTELISDATPAISPEGTLPAILVGLALLVCSPVFLYLNRIASTGAVVFVFAALVIARRQRLIKARIDTASTAFLVLMLANGAGSLAAGQSAVEVISQLAPVVEVFVIFRFATQISLSEETTAKWLNWMLLMVLLRAALQLALVATGHVGFVPPVYGDQSIEDTAISIANVTFIRPIDPLMGFFAAVAFVLYTHNICRRRAAAVMGLGAAVCLLGLIRAEWIATLVTVVLALFLRGRVPASKVILPVAVLAVGALLVNAVIPGLSDIAERRLIDYTAQQMNDPQTEVAQTRILEMGTVIGAFADHPIVGVGIGDGIGTQLFNGYRVIFEPIHNYYLNILAKAGSVGIIMLAWVGLASLKLAISLERAARTEMQHALAVCALVALVWWAIFIAFHPIYLAYHIPVLVGLFLGMALSLRVPSPTLSECEAK
jgi:hypothetical protein